MRDVLLEDLSRPAPERLERVLGVGRSTVYRWTTPATRAVCGLRERDQLQARLARVPMLPDASAVNRSIRGD
jgi:hypothetical protein